MVASNFWVGSPTGQHSGLFPEVEQVHGPWCHQVVSYQFGQLFTSQTTVSEHILDLGLFVRDPQGGDFLENWAFFYKTDPLKLSIKRRVFFVFSFEFHLN